MTEADYIETLSAFIDVGPAPPEVIRCSTQSIVEFPDSAALWFLRGQLLWSTGNENVSAEGNAATSFEIALKIDPGMKEARVALASLRDLPAKSNRELRLE